MGYPLEYYLMPMVGEDPPSDLSLLPKFNYEYYLQILVGESPDLFNPPKRPLSYYLAILLGVDPVAYASMPEEWFWTQLIGENELYPLPKKPLGHYLSLFTPEAFMFRVGTSVSQGFGQLSEYGKGDPPLPDFWLDGNDLKYDNATLPSGYSNLRIEDDGKLWADKA
jgi:hypothetical protein